MTISVNPSLHTFSSPHFESVVNEAITFLANTPIHPLPPVNTFVGVGVYVLYYVGEYEHYNHVGAFNKNECNFPIYVGKAVPAGWRTARLSVENSRSLSGRLREHARSIEQTEKWAKAEGLENYLKVADFRCRFIIFHGIEADLISAVEAHSIRRWKPLWNTLIDGFGNHDPGKGRYNQAISEWDVLHKGRSWTERVMGTAPNLDNILKKIEQHRNQSSST